jgi:hypothetical protein
VKKGEMTKRRKDEEPRENNLFSTAASKIPYDKPKSCSYIIFTGDFIDSANEANEKIL